MLKMIKHKVEIDSVGGMKISRQTSGFVADRR